MDSLEPAALDVIAEALVRNSPRDKPVCVDKVSSGNAVEQALQLSIFFGIHDAYIIKYVKILQHANLTGATDCGAPIGDVLPNPLGIEIERLSPGVSCNHVHFRRPIRCNSPRFSG